MFAIITHEIEEKVTRELTRWFRVEKEISVFSLIHDGFIASKCSVELLREAEAHIKDLMSIDIQLLEKPMYGLQEHRIPELEPLYTNEDGETPHELPDDGEAEGKQRGKRLELDGYCETAKIAFEFQGAQHYESNHLYHRGKARSFEDTIANDKAKVQLCKDNGVTLVVVPHFIPNTQVPEFVRNELLKCGVKCSRDSVPKSIASQPRIIDEGGINVTGCMTAAGIAKRMFYNTFYGEHPLFCMTKEQDRFIRNSYFGGRVELFQHGVVHGKVWYLDFTSLYPAMGHKHLIPYGCPTIWDTFDPPPGNESMGFGKHCALTREAVRGENGPWLLCMGHAPG